VWFDPRRPLPPAVLEPWVGASGCDVHLRLAWMVVESDVRPALGADRKSI